MNDINSKYLVFEVDEAYALELSNVVEIIEYTDISRVPETADYIAGIINLRGHVIPVLDVRKRFRKPVNPEVTPRCIIITSIEENSLGLIVDNVLDLIEIDPSNIKDPPQVGTNYIHVFVKAIGITENKMHLIVDTEKLVNHEDIQPLSGEAGEDASPDEEI